MKNLAVGGARAVEEAAVIAKDKTVLAAEVAKDKTVEGAAIVGNAVSDGANWTWGKAKSGWRRLVK